MCTVFIIIVLETVFENKVSFSPSHCLNKNVFKRSNYARTQYYVFGSLDFGQPLFVATTTAVYALVRVLSVDF